jgi:hypothetical protein
MQQNGDGAKQIYITEAGWNDSPRWNQAVTPAQRIENTLKALDWVKDQDWIEMLALWVFSYPQATHTFADNWTFVTDDLRPKPIYEEVKKQLIMTNDQRLTASHRRAPCHLYALDIPYHASLECESV